MILTNYHTHCHFCDGMEEPEAYVAAALAKGFRALGFSSHGPVPFPNDWTMRAENVFRYLEEIRRLKRVYQDQIQLYAGMELDYFPEDRRQVFKAYKLDYTLGAVHCIADAQQNICYSIDGTEAEFVQTLEQRFEGDIRRLVAVYYQLLGRMALEERPDIVAHFDVIKKNNGSGRYFTEKEHWYRDAVEEALQRIAQSGAILEVNTGGILRGYLKEVYPSPWILKECRRLYIPVMVNSDAHTPADLDGYFEPARRVLRDAGYRVQRVLLDGRWVDLALE